jgi:hypothetical protein
MNDPNQPAPASAPGQPKKKNRTLLYVGVGCLGLITLCCCTGGGLALFQTNRVDDAAISHAEYFLDNVQLGSWDAALASSEWMGDTTLYSSGQMQLCFQATPLSDMSAYTCDEADGQLWEDDRDVTCTIQSVSQGSQEISIHVNSATDMPYLGFVWFSPTATVTPTWSGDECARWSGRDYFDEPPAGFVRPQAAPSFGF